MTKNYQRTALDTNGLTVPDQVSVAMNEIAAELREGLLALAVGAGLPAWSRGRFGHRWRSSSARVPAPDPGERRIRGAVGAGL